VNISNYLKKICFWLAAFLFFYSCKHDKAVTDVAPPQEKTHSGIVSSDSLNQSGTYFKRKSGIPAQAYIVLDYIKENNRTMPGYVGGRLFYNRENNLPKTGSDTIIYREWDIYPKIKGRSRGPERLITGSNGSAYYTNNHYRTFTKIYPHP